MTVSVRHREVARGHRRQAVETARLENRPRILGLFLGGEEPLLLHRQDRSLLSFFGHLFVHGGGQHGLLLAATVAGNRL